MTACVYVITYYVSIAVYSAVSEAISIFLSHVRTDSIPERNASCIVHTRSNIPVWC